MEKIIVAFKIGRGGRFYNGGHKTYIGQQPINDFIGDLFLNEETNIYMDSNGNEVLDAEYLNEGIGIIDLDGEYDTTICKYLSQCNDSELNLINLNTDYKTPELIEELKKYICEDIW